MIENDETCTLAFRMAALEELVAERIETTLPASTIQDGTAPWYRSQAANAARLRAEILLTLGAEYCEHQSQLEWLAEAEGLQ